MTLPKLEAAEAYFSCPLLSGWTTIKHYDSDVDALWSICEDDEDSLQVIYERRDMPPGSGEKQDFWLYLSPDAAAVVGTLLLAWAKSREAA